MNGSEKSSKLKYRHFCKSESSIPLFSQDWWLDALCGLNNWDVVLVEKGGQIQATMPYYMPNKRTIKMPKLTQTMGPWIRHGEGKYTAQLSREMELMSELIEQLPKVWYFNQNFHHSVTNWLPFFWKGYKQTTQYTYVIENLYDIERVWENIAGKQVRSPIRKAQREGIRVVDDRSLDDFLAVNDLTFERQDLRNSTPKALVQRMWNAARARESAKMHFAVDKDDRIHAASLLVWTPECAYYLMGGGDPQLRSSGAQNLVMWESIKFAATVAKSFDFEGSMLEGVENSFRRFGATQVPYFMLTRAHPVIAIVLGCRHLIGTIRHSRFFP